MTSASEQLRGILGGARIIPLLTITHAADAVPVARALLAGGIGVAEVALRTANALEAIRAIVDQVHGMKVGAGTVLERSAVREAKDAGAAFIVSPGLDEEVVAAAAEAALPCLPGVMTPGEIMRAHRLGLDLLKFFPAEAAGGVTMLKALGGPFPHISFCPTGGVNAGNAGSYLALGNVFAVGGSWIAPDSAIAEHGWNRISELARAATRM